jgi:succinyl-CoA synthetase alpha subunit
MKQYELFTKQTQAIVYGLQKNAIQSMLDFDFMCERDKPSVAAIVQPSQTEEKSNFKIFWGRNEILIPVYRQLEYAIDKHPEADVFINFASFRSAYDTTLRALESESLRTIVIIAEGIPERQTRELIKVAKQKERILIGPATVGGVKAGAFKIGNAAGTVENVRLSKLYRPGSVGFVSKSGGMSNEMYFLISQCTNGIYEGIAIGGDRYPGSQLIDHVLRFEDNPKIKMIVCLGELGGLEEYAIADSVRDGIVKKPVIMWVAGDSMKILPKGTQFGHAGAMANSEKEKAESKNKALSKAGVIVPESFDDIGKKIRETYEELQKQGLVSGIEETEPPEIPMDFDRALRTGMVRRQSDITSTISDDRGDILTYNGKQIDDIIQTGKSLGYIIGLLWFKKELTGYAQNYIELVLKLTADHGPAVSGAHNAIVSARAGKDLVSSLTSGILTIGPRFGGAISDTAKYFGHAYDNDMSPKQFIDYMKSEMRII